MPTYDYECQYCEITFEVNKPMSQSDEPEKCRKCGGECHKIISGGSGFILGGEGWAKDGYSDPVKGVNKNDKNGGNE